jgi:hypothetical protein
MYNSVIDNTLPKKVKTKINFTLYTTIIIVCILSMYIPSKISFEPTILNDFVKYSLILILILILGFGAIKYFTIRLMSLLFKISSENIEAYLFNNRNFETSSIIDTKFYVPFPFRYHLLQIPIYIIILTFLLSGFAIGLFHHSLEITPPITNIHFITNSEIAKGKLVDYEADYVEDDQGRTGKKEWYGYKFNVAGQQYMCWIPRHEEKNIEVQYLDFDPKENRLYVEKSKETTILYLIGSFTFTVIVILYISSSKFGQAMWQTAIYLIPINKE